MAVSNQKSDYCLRVFKKHGVLPVFEGEPQGVNIKAALDHETFSQWTLRVLGRPHNEVQVAVVRRVAPNKLVKNLGEAPSQDELRAVLKAQARQSQRVLLRRQSKAQQIDAEADSDLDSSDPGSATKTEFSAFVAEISATYPESVQEFFLRLATEQEDVIEWEDLFKTLADRYAKLAAQYRNRPVNPVSRNAEITPSSTSGSVGADSAALPASDVMVTASRVLNDLLPQAPEVLKVQSMSQHPDFENYSEDFGAAASAKLIVSELSSYCEELKNLVDSLPYMDKTAEALAEFSGTVDQLDEDDSLDPAYETDPALPTQDRRADERAFIDELLASADALHEAFNEVEEAFNEDLETAPSEYDALVSAPISKAFNNVTSLLDKIFEC